MAQLRCEVVTAERTVFEGEVDLVLAPGINGQVGILPHHAPLMTALSFGELILRRESLPDEFIAIGDIWTKLSLTFKDFSGDGGRAVLEAAPMAREISGRETEAFKELEAVYEEIPGGEA